VCCCCKAKASKALQAVWWVEKRTTYKLCSLMMAYGCGTYINCLFVVANASDVMPCARTVSCELLRSVLLHRPLLHSGSRDCMDGNA
jgi:hypothetical protein